MPLTGSQKALMYSLSGVERCGATRCGYTSSKTFVSVNGVQYATNRPVDANKVLDGSLSITEVLHETSNTATFTMQGAEPTEGQDVVVTLGSINNLDRTFAGTILNRTHAYVGTPGNWNAPINVIDYTWQLTRRRFFGSYTNAPAATVLAAIVANVPGFTASAASGLPTVTITWADVTALQALSQLATAIGGYCDVDYHKVVKLFITDASVTNPVTLVSGLSTLSEFSYARDLSPVVTQQPVQGGGSTSLANVPVGDTLIPVAEPSWFNASGGTVLTGPQLIAYTGKTQATPTTPPTVAAIAGAGIDNGPHQYAYTFGTGSGETTPSLLSTTVVSETLPAAPAIRAITANTAVGGPAVGTTMSYVIAIIKDVAALSSIGFSAGITDPLLFTTQVAAGNTSYTVDCIATAGMFGRYVGLFRSDSGGGGSVNYFLMDYFLCATTAGNIASFQADIATHNVNTAFSSVFLPLASWTGFGQVNQAQLSVVPIGPSGTTSRKVYRNTILTPATFQLQQTIANNSATTGVTDSTADASLGAVAPTTDTSGLVLNAVSTTSGATTAGSPTMNLVSGAAFLSAGGWVIVANIPVRYTGKASNQLTGIPTSGAGSITAAIPSASTVTSCATLTGIPASGAGSILYPIKTGDPVNLRVVVNNAPAQSTLAALLGGGDDGIVVGALISVSGISEVEAIARGTAALALNSAPLVTLTYKTRDTNTHAGRTITVSFGAPTNIVGTFEIQRVTIDTFQPALMPTRTVTATSNLFSLEDLLRLVRQQ